MKIDYLIITYTAIFTILYLIRNFNLRTSKRKNTCYEKIPNAYFIYDFYTLLLIADSFLFFHHYIKTYILPNL